MATDTFKFIHTADLHLDSPFVGISHMDEDIASELREATFRTFEQILDVYHKHGIDYSAYCKYFSQSTGSYGIYEKSGRTIVTITREVKPEY